MTKLVSGIIVCSMVAAMSVNGYGAENEGPLFAGTAKVEITPPVGVPMCGYNENAVSKGIHDPLFARILVLKAGDTQLAIVSADLVYFWSDRVITEAKQKYGINYVILCASHTHAGPTIVGMPVGHRLEGSGQANADPVRLRDEWYSKMEDNIIAAIGEAASNLFPACIGAGMGPVDSKYLSYNRRFKPKDSKYVKMMWTNPSHTPNGPIDPMVRVIRVDDDKGKTRALMIHYAAHPVTLGSGNRRISADFPGPMAAYVEEELGNGAVAMFLQGAAGDTHPFDAVMSNNTKALEAITTTGVSLGKSALSVAKGIEMDDNPASIRAKENLLHLSYRKEPNKFDDAGVMAVVINNDIAMGVLIYEPFVGHQLALVARSPIKNTLLVGYAYFGQGVKLDTYLPTIEATKVGGYGAGTASNDANVFEVGAGEKMVDLAVESIRELAGMPPAAEQ